MVEVPEIMKDDFWDKMDENKKFLAYDLDKCAYKKTYVAYIDILGYKNLIESLHDDAPKIIFKIVRDAVKFNEGLYKSIKLILFSDSLIIWSTGGEDIVNFLNLANVVNIIRESFIKAGIFIRGGISFGDHFDFEDIIVSPALIRSYLIESNYSIFPRIIIDDQIYKKVMSEFIRLKNGVSGIPFQGMFRILIPDGFYRDFDGKYILHPLLGISGVYFLFSGIGDWLPEDQVTDEWKTELRNSGLSDLRRHREIIIKELFRNCNERERIKVQYLANQFNNILLNLKSIDAPDRENLKIPFSI